MCNVTAPFVQGVRGMAKMCVNVTHSSFGEYFYTVLSFTVLSSKRGIGMCQSKSWLALMFEKEMFYEQSSL